LIGAGREPGRLALSVVAGLVSEGHYAASPLAALAQLRSGGGNAFGDRVEFHLREDRRDVGDELARRFGGVELLVGGGSEFLVLIAPS
jgi:hypothetical protein